MAQMKKQVRRKAEAIRWKVEENNSLETSRKK
jgi:hypothetical protein